MLPQQCYDILGVSAKATNEQIKRAYRKRAKELHPDANSAADANIKFQLLNEAYHTLLKEKEYIFVVDDFSIEDYKRYGTSVRNKSYKQNYNQQNKESRRGEPEYKPNKAPGDKYMYYVLVLIGLNMLVYAVKKFVIEKKEESGGMMGVLSAIYLLIIIIYGWNVLKKS